tara:strand:+ start:16717 stop:17637 length:921 start_codon:yes stop_codon:yes gene_type:complete
MILGILVTGSTGFIGRELISLIRDARCVVRSYNQISDDLFFVKSIDLETDWNGAFEDVEVVVHLAGLAHSYSFTEREYQEVNVGGTLHLANEAVKSGVKRFVFVSSIGVNGTSTHEVPFSSDSTPNPHNAYAQSKYDAEIGLQKISKETGLEVVIVRPTLVYGPTAPGNFGSLHRLVSRVPVLPFGLIENKRSFIAVQNLVDLLITCMYHPNASGCIFLASEGEPLSTKAFTNAIAEGVGKHITQLPVPSSLMRLVGQLTKKSAMVEQLVGNLEVDSSDLQTVLNWKPPYTMKQAMSSLLANTTRE